MALDYVENRLYTYSQHKQIEIKIYFVERRYVFFYQLLNIAYTPRQCLIYSIAMEQK